MTNTALPTEERPIRMDPELAAEVNKFLEPLSGKDLKKGRDAVMSVYNSGITGSFGELLAAYRSAIEEATR